ncbi:hypothetical protein DM01DRAFT_1127891 [Hesseltinella vesiculosa]|uniref:1,3-beta-glucanosyltransferase n=1 Tax=Hesseltinella vesiculosa TaxID=101127 RepID=A0A1X2GUJ0_9FUNG|nr:hypothetical protein DM01DRAFT_1127891 [Hesseltinella vesiculosa]
MIVFADNGLYLLLDVPTPNKSINRKSPLYDVEMYNSYKATVAAFAKYPRLLAFVAGNEVTNDKTATPASPFVRSIIRDMKTFLAKNGGRAIPVVYASNDDQFIRDDIKDYFVCGDEDSQADFFGVNLYEWSKENNEYGLVMICNAVTKPIASKNTLAPLVKRLGMRDSVPTRNPLVALSSREPTSTRSLKLPPPPSTLPLPPLPRPPACGQKWWSRQVCDPCRGQAS